LLSVISVDINAPYPGGPDIGFVELAFVLDLSLVQHGLPAPSCLVNGATFYSAPATAGTISTLFGSNLGPSTGVSYQLGADGLIPNVLGGTSLTVGGVPAPLLYAQDTQINFVVPQQLSGNTTNICITRSGAQSCMVAFTALEWPVIFCVSAPCTSYSTGFAILNQNGTLNTPSNPASLNSVIQIFGTGMGPYDRTLMDGSIVGPPLAHLTSQVQATFYGAVTCQVEISISTFPICTPAPTFPGTVLFAGAAPMQLVGIDQINVQIPLSAAPSTTAPLTLQIGTLSTQAILAIK
jgi:uncharacterized protein (TIGR03437 family)